MRIHEGRLYGLRRQAGRGFVFVGLDCKTGNNLFRAHLQKGYGGTPNTRLRRPAYGGTLVVQVRDRQDFELRAFDMKTGKLSHKLKIKGVGDFGRHGRASATVQNGCLVLHGQSAVKIAGRGK
jgi:hypothetical protein